MINGSALYPPSTSRLRSLSARTAVQVSARREATRTNDLDGGEDVGGQLDLPAVGCEDGGVVITESDRAPRGYCAIMAR